jgi:hypothetical protein
MVGLVGRVVSPASWSPAGHRAVVAGPREEKSRQEEKDDRRGRLVSERVREGECTRASGPRGLALLGRAQASASEREWAARAGGLVGIFVELQKY